ncbi:ATP-binding protein [Rubrivivax albus]|uniref:NB-ARC domain-containing protein n=1 Tax=Rubrivivax albus TaxID=2499835 RepID=A0A437JY03_9BURK|nr:NB-ARC domain-containing protein [Rubrivivax albus]RVT52543.1 hypothetical protein ENE75_08925 [Rubrivivax albus]
MEPALPASPAMAPPWHLRLLDTVSLADPQGRPVPLPGRMAPLLLARLALAPRRAWPRETLVALLWPNADPAVGRNRLRQLLSALGSALVPFGGPPLIQADRDSVGLRPGALYCDADDPRARGELLPGHQAEWVNDERRARERDEPAPAPAALPHPPTRWLGDPALLVRLQAAVQTRRIVTLSGAGGSGKTRAALEVAHALQGHFDRIAWVALADCRTAAAMQERWLIALGLGGHGDAVGTLSTALAGRRVLLVLDNLEQIAVDAGSPLAQLVSRTPGLHLLLTSRCALEIDGEAVFPWAGLGEPAPRLPLDTLARHPAMALLIDRAQAVRPGFRLEPSNADALVALLQRLGGLPLAIELAASRLRATEPATLLALLQDRVQAAALLQRGGERSGHDSRPASLQETMRWSWNLLSPPARAVLDAVSSFDGAFDAEAAAALHGAPVALALDELVRHSLLQYTPGPLPYTMHPLMRDDLRHAIAPETSRRYSTRLRAWTLAWAHALPPSPPLGPLRRQLPLLAHAIASAETEGTPQEAVALFMALQRGLSDISLPRSTREVLSRCIATLADADNRAVARAALARAARRGRRTGRAACGPGRARDAGRWCRTRSRAGARGLSALAAAPRCRHRPLARRGPGAGTGRG